MIKVRSLAKYRLRIIVTSVVVAFLVIWLGVPTFNKWRADRLVDELCEKNGGIKVYESVRLPPERFDRWAQVRLPSKRFMTEEDNYYYIRTNIDIVGSSSSADIGKLAVVKSINKVFRKKDHKLLGKSIHYARLGGDPIGPWHPSSYSCRPPNGLESKIFKKLKSR